MTANQPDEKRTMSAFCRRLNRSFLGPSGRTNWSRAGRTRGEAKMQHVWTEEDSLMRRATVGTRFSHDDPRFLNEEELKRLTKTELVRIARQEDLPYRTKMNKAQLARTLRKHFRQPS